jgi:hypothetical protein
VFSLVEVGLGFWVGFGQLDLDGHEAHIC